LLREVLLNGQGDLHKEVILGFNEGHKPDNDFWYLKIVIGEYEFNSQQSFFNSQIGKRAAKKAGKLISEAIGASFKTRA